jgi:hypothetical protein
VLAGKVVIEEEYLVVAEEEEIEWRLRVLVDLYEIEFGDVLSDEVLFDAYPFGPKPFFL